MNIMFAYLPLLDLHLMYIIWLTRAIQEVSRAAFCSPKTTTIVSSPLPMENKERGVSIYGTLNHSVGNPPAKVLFDYKN